MEKDDSNTIIAKYIYGIDEIIRMEREGEINYYCYDGSGSVTEITDTSQNVVESYAYDDFGKPDNISFIGNPFFYTGNEYEKELE